MSIRRPHATCIINAQPKDTTTTFTTRTFPSADLLHTQQPTNTCVQMEMDEQHSTGRSKVSQTAFWNIIAPPTQQMCRDALSLLSLEVFLLGNTILSFCLLAASEGGCVTFSGSLCPSIPAGSLPTLHLSCGRRNTRPEDEMRFRESLQILSFVEWLSPQTSLKKTAFQLRSQSSECKSQLFHFILSVSVISVHPTTCFL